MKTQIFFGLLLTTALVLGVGLEGDYVIVVDEDAPTSDVVTAANFAASVSQYATFSGVELADAQSLSEEDLEGKYVVIISGNSVTLLGSDENDDLFKQYFQDQGFVVDTKDSPQKEYLVLPEPIEEPEIVEALEPSSPELEEEVIDSLEEEVADTLQEQVIELTAAPVEAFICEGCVFDEQCYAVGNILSVDGMDHECTVEGLAPVEQPGFFTRFLNWLANLF